MSIVARVVNVPFMSQPANWVIVTLMVLFGIQLLRIVIERQPVEN